MEEEFDWKAKRLLENPRESNLAPRTYWLSNCSEDAPEIYESARYEWGVERRMRLRKVAGTTDQYVEEPISSYGLI